jgi:hypothetical protein
MYLCWPFHIIFQHCPPDHGIHHSYYRFFCSTEHFKNTLKTLYSVKLSCPISIFVWLCLLLPSSEIGLGMEAQGCLEIEAAWGRGTLALRHINVTMLNKVWWQICTSTKGEWMNRWMNEQINEWTDEWMNWMNEWMNEWNK